MARSRWLTEAVGFQTLREALERLGVDDLKRRARLFESKPPKRKAELVAHLNRQLRGDGLLRLWGQLGDLAQKAVSEAVHDSDGPLDTNRFGAKYGALPNWHTSRSLHYRDRKTPPEPLSMLIFGEGWVPDDLKERLMEFAPEPGESALATVTDLPSHALGSDASSAELSCEETALAALHDVRAVLALVDEGKVKVGAKTGQASLAGAKAILPFLRNGDFLAGDMDAAADAKTTIRPFAWPLLLQAGRLAEIAGSKLRLTKAGKKALTSAPHEVIQLLWNRWLKSTLFDEFRRVSEIKGQTKSGVLSAVADRRASISIGLKAASAGEWIEVNEFVRHIVATGNGFAVARKPWSLYISDARYGSLGYEGYSNWLPKWYLMVFLWEYAGTLGLIDVAYTDPEHGHSDYRGNWGADWQDFLCIHEGLFYFRINNLGAWVLGLSSEFTAPTQDAQPVLRVLPNHEVTVTARVLAPADGLFLDRVARRKGNRVWSLELPKLLRAVEEGLPLTDIESFLKAKCDGSSLPDTVADLFREARSRVGWIVSRGSARIYTCEDPALAKLVCGDTRLSSLCHLAGDHLLVVPSDSDQRFREALRRLGYVATPVPASSPMTS
jgi:hypothetical protein